MAREKPFHLQMRDFCHYHLGKGCFAPFTGTDYPAWNAFAYLLQCYSHGGGNTAIAALRQTLATAQHTEAVLRAFVQVIPGALDWSDVAKLWPVIACDVTIEDKPGEHASTLYAIERSEHYRGSSNQVETKIWRHGLGSPSTAFDISTGATP